MSAGALNSPWTPCTWVDLVEPVALLLNELLSRFQQQRDFDSLRPAAEAMLTAVKNLLDRHVRAIAVPSGTRWRRLNECLRSIAR